MPSSKDAFSDPASSSLDMPEDAGTYKLIPVLDNIGCMYVLFLILNGFNGRNTLICTCTILYVIFLSVFFAEENIYADI